MFGDFEHKFLQTVEVGFCNGIVTLIVGIISLEKKCLTSSLMSVVKENSKKLLYYSTKKLLYF